MVMVMMMGMVVVDIEGAPGEEQGKTEPQEEESFHPLIYARSALKSTP
ncbi:hypothetical protein SAMN05444156_1361 [Verrucomicrobium sp. GAS474]|nr:hypothetical protein SAMN05444156_1361 [Verrucomicrobium sp. GAS474]